MAHHCIDTATGHKSAIGMSAAPIGLPTVAPHAVARPERPSTRDVMRGRIIDFIDAHLTDADLSIARISKSIGCTKRYLHKIFSDQESLHTYIRTRRLDQAHADLADPRLRDRSITDIAMDCGFSTPAYFSRAFKQRYGTSPRGFRERIASTGGGRSACSQIPAS